MKKIYSIDDESKGLSLRSFIKKKFENLTSREIEALLSKNGCKVNRTIERFGSKKLTLTDTVELFPHFLQKNKNEKITTLFEDDHLLIINKPADIPSSKRILSELLNQSVLLVHRLDKPTSGVLILAKTTHAQSQIEELFYKQEIEKTYIAITHGRMSDRKGLIEKPLKIKKRYEGGVIYMTTIQGKKAITHWEKAFSSKTETLFILKPISGKTHQLRVHLESIGHPILGDPVYKDKQTSPYNAERLMLHSRKVVFTHPFTHKKIEIIAPIPIIIRQTISKLFKNQNKCAF